MRVMPRMKPRVSRKSSANLAFQIRKWVQVMNGGTRNIPVQLSELPDFKGTLPADGSSTLKRARKSSQSPPLPLASAGLLCALSVGGGVIAGGPPATPWPRRGREYLGYGRCCLGAWAIAGYRQRATTRRRTASGRVGHAATTAARSGSIGAESPENAPVFAPPWSPSPRFPEESAMCSTPLGVPHKALPSRAFCVSERPLPRASAEVSRD